MMVRLEGVKKIYDGKTVLNVDELQINKGELCGIIGPNGAGKSTMLNLIAGLAYQTEGHIYYGDDKQERIPYMEMTMVFQSPYLIRTTTEKNIAYPLKLRRWSESAKKARVDQLISDLGLIHQRKQKAWTLSAGESQKTALARALSFRPKLLLLDEPTANIDPTATAELERMLLKINKEEGTTVLVVTHNLAQAKRLCSSVVFMNEGMVVESGESSVILKNPGQLLTRRFIEGELLL